MHATAKIALSTQKMLSANKFRRLTIHLYLPQKLHNSFRWNADIYYRLKQPQSYNSNQSANEISVELQLIWLHVYDTQNLVCIVVWHSFTPCVIFVLQIVLFFPLQIWLLNFNFRISYCKVGQGNPGSWRPPLFKSSCLKNTTVIYFSKKTHKTNLRRMKFAAICSCLFQTFGASKPGRALIVLLCLPSWLIWPCSADPTLFLPASSESDCEQAQGLCETQSTSPQTMVRENRLFLLLTKERGEATIMSFLPLAGGVVWAL